MGVLGMNKSRLGSYRTYEEWKPTTVMPMIIAATPSSYRTYEEWKPPLLRTKRLQQWVLTVPMRNGNVTSKE